MFVTVLYIPQTASFYALPLNIDEHKNDSFTNKTGNWPWWPSDLECVSNSSRCSLKDPGSNPARGKNLYGRNLHML